MLLLPASAAVTPPAKELALVLLHLVRVRDPSLVILEKVVDAVEYRLVDAAILDSLQAVEVARIARDLQSSFIDTVKGLLSGPCAGQGDTIKRAAPLLGRIAPAIGRFMRALEAVPPPPARSAYQEQLSGASLLALTEEGDEQPPWRGWHHNPTIGWLAKGDWLNSPQLQPRYESVANYTETLQRLMTLLTFYWGAGALWPKCRYRQGGGPAGDVIARCPFGRFVVVKVTMRHVLMISVCHR
jgi:hypothetical protein